MELQARAQPTRIILPLPHRTLPQQLTDCNSISLIMLFHQSAQLQVLVTRPSLVMEVMLQHTPRAPPDMEP